MNRYPITITLPEDIPEIILKSRLTLEEFCRRALQSGLEPDNYTIVRRRKNIRITVGAGVWHRLQLLSYTNKKYINLIAGEIIIKYLINRCYHEN